MAQSPASSTKTIAVSDAQHLLNVNMSNVTKLTASNYMMWSRQIHALLDGYDLAGYVDGSIVVPPSTITNDGVVSVNTAYTLWKRQDKLLYSALLGAISISIQPILSKAQTSADIWETLSSTYANPSSGNCQQLRQQIRQWKKGNKSISNYIQGFTLRFDELSLLGKAMEHEDQVDYILEGLPEEYRQVVDQINGRDTLPSITEIHEKLINYEVKLQTAANIVTASSIPISANVANTGGGYINNKFQGNNNYQHRSQNRNNQTWQQPKFQPRQDNSDQRGYQGRCQICGINGHSARPCSKLQLSGGSYNPTPSSYSNAGVPWQPRAHMALKILEFYRITS